MPTYSFICDKCGVKREEARPVDARNSPCSCEICGHKMRRDYGAEQGHMRMGDLPDWLATDGGFLIPRDNETKQITAEGRQQLAQIRRTYDDLGVKVMENGNAIVPGKNRKAFLKRRGLCDLH
jgi:putative FmdB family regulatory protein